MTSDWDFLATLEGNVLGTSWGQIFAGWVATYVNDLCHSLINHQILIKETIQKQMAAVVLNNTCLEKLGNFTRTLCGGGF